MKTDNRPLGVFDSGLGGLTVVTELRKAMPNEDIIYLGDTARVPYGNKSPETIAKFAEQDARFLVSKGVKALIAACNTVSSVAIPALTKKFPNLPIINVLEAGIEACIREKPSSVLVIGTRATIASDAYRRYIHQKDSSINVYSVTTPLFVPIVEEGLHNHAIAEEAVKFYLSDFISKPPDIILLACTHYPLLKNTISKIFSAKCKIVDSAESTAKFAAQKLSLLQINASVAKSGTERFFVTDTPCNFYIQAKNFLGREIEFPEKISL